VTDPDCRCTADPDDPRPWERPGSVRRDCEPHRGRLLLQLADTAVMFGGMAFLFPPAALLGLALGSWTLALTGNDRERMRAGRMDPGGDEEAARAASAAQVAMTLSAGSFAMWATLLAVLCLVGSR
jgi:hypothetical protein